MRKHNLMCGIFLNHARIQKVCVRGGWGGGSRSKVLTTLFFGHQLFLILTEGRGAPYKYSKENLYPVAKWLDTDCWLCNFKIFQWGGGIPVFLRNPTAL